MEGHSSPQSQKQQQQHQHQNEPPMGNRCHVHNVIGHLGNQPSEFDPPTPNKKTTLATTLMFAKCDISTTSQV
eukprot:scaffold56615_cov53-Attheya_sp.AAC.2